MAIGTPTFIGANTNDAAGVSSVAVNVTANCIVGDLILIGGVFGHASNTPTPTATDTAGNTYTCDNVNHMLTGGTPHSFILSATVTTQLNSGQTVTVSFSPAINRPIIDVYHVTGIATSSFVDQAAGNHGTSTTPSSGNITTTQAAELLFGAMAFGAASTDGGYSAGSGWTAVNPQNNTAKSLVCQYQIVAATGTYASNGTITSDDWAASIASYKGIVAGKLFLQSSLDGLGAGGPFFHDRLA